MVVGSNPVAVTYTLDFAPVSSREFFDIQAIVECGFSLKRVRGMIGGHSLDGYFYLLLSIKLFSEKKSVLLKLHH